jgi:hypothetical protein
MRGIRIDMARPAMHASLRIMHQDWVLKLAEIVGPRIPACLRRIPDLRYDYAYEGEVKLAVPFYSQTDWYSCGPVAASIVGETFHPRTDFAALYRECHPEPLEGTTASKLVRALRRFGVGVSVRRNLGFDSLATAIESGFPIIAGVADGEYGHWAVVYGVNRRRKRLFVCNVGWIGHSREEFTWREWKTWWAPVGEGLICWGKRLGRRRRR